MTPEDALAIYQSGPEITVAVLCQQAAQLSALQEHLRQLEGQLAQNSGNSSNPPSSDGFHKPAPKSLRPRGERKPGGQPGHTGHTLKMVEHPHRYLLSTGMLSPFRPPQVAFAIKYDLLPISAINLLASYPRPGHNKYDCFLRSLKVPIPPPDTA